MDAAIYQGTEHPELVGKSALVRPHPENREGYLVAQFDDLELRSPTIPDPRSDQSEGFKGLRWGLGWHELPIKDMALVVRVSIGW